MPAAQTTAVDAIQQIQAGVAQRIAEADQEAYESSIAFTAGKFEEYFQRKCQATAKGIADEYAQIVGQGTDGGDCEAGG